MNRETGLSRDEYERIRRYPVERMQGNELAVKAAHESYVSDAGQRNIGVRDRLKHLLSRLTGGGQHSQVSIDAGGSYLTEDKRVHTGNLKTGK